MLQHRIEVKVQQIKTNLGTMNLFDYLQKLGFKYDHVYSKIITISFGGYY